MLPTLNFRALAIVLGAILLLSLAGYGLQRCQQQRNEKAIERPASEHAAHQALQAARRQDFDTVLFSLIGQRREAALHTAASTAQATKSQAAYDSARNHLPAVLAELPVQPPRYRPTKREAAPSGPAPTHRRAAGAR